MECVASVAPDIANHTLYDVRVFRTVMFEGQSNERAVYACLVLENSTHRVYTGTAVVHPNDKDNINTGAYIAFKRAIEQIPDVSAEAASARKTTKSRASASRAF